MDEQKTSATGVELPEDLTGASDRDLQGLKSKIAAKFEKLKDKETLTSADLELMAALKDQMTTVRAEEGNRVAAQNEAKAKRDELVAEMESDGASDAEVDGDVLVEADDTETVADVVSIDVKAEDADSEDEVVEEASQADSLAASLVAAIESIVKGGAQVEKAAGRASISDVARSNRTEVKEVGNVSIVAAAGIDRVQMGSSLDRDGLSTAMHEKARMLSNGSGRHLVASISPNEIKNDIRKIKSDNELRVAWDKATKVPEQGLVASGGWCAPSETVYDFVCDFEAMPEVLDLPSITANRGGLRYPISPLLGDVFDDINSGFTWTEEDDIAAAEPGGPTKPCFTIPCPEFDETRLQAQGVCITAGNLTDRAYPELTNRYIDLVMTAHAHRMNGLTIAKVVDESTAVSPTVTDLSATEAILAGIELQIACLRDEYFMGADQVLEIGLPRWVRTVVRRDLARRAGVAFNQISNAEIAGFFTEIGARAQFVSNWQSLRAQADPGCLVLPESVDILVYPAGSHVKLDGGSLDLGVVRDSTLNATNDYTAAWTEEFWGVVSRCVSLVVTVPLCADGRTGVAQQIACPTA